MKQPVVHCQADVKLLNQPHPYVRWQIFLTLVNFHLILQRLLLHQVLVYATSAFEDCHRKIFYPLLTVIE